MSFPKYAEYKASGFVWTSELPVHWDSTSLKWVCDRYSGGTPDKNKLDFWEGGTIPWLNSGAVNDGRIYEASAFITQEAFENSSAKWIPPGALVMALAGQGKTKGMVAQLMFASTCNQSMAALVPSERINARFLYWWLVCNYQNIRNMAGGDLRDGLNLDLLGGIPCPLPLVAEQTNIATFLDRETDKIDALITQQEKLIALLAEKRQATISHAVTKGLNTNVPMKDSGVPWLGEIPAHWDLKRVKDCGCEIIDCKNRTPEQHPDGKYFVVRTSCVKDGKFSMAEGFFTDQANFIEWTKKGKPQPGDVLFTREAPTGEACLAPEGLDFCLGQRLMFIRPPSEVLVNEFLLYSIYGGLVRERIDSKSKGSTVGHLRVGEVGDLPLLLPAPIEQRQVAEFINSELKKLDSLRAKAEHAIALLKERRNALIAAAVTGQIDVRDAILRAAAASQEALAA